jgi:hypothetical protein
MMLMATGVVMGLSGPARAAAGIDATPTTVWSNGQRVHVTWSGMTPRASVYIDQCDNVQAIKPQAFDYGSDCATLGEQSIDGQTYNVTGSGATNVNGAVDPDFKTFVGPEPSGILGWGCGPNGSPEGVKVGGLTMYNPCLLRIADSAPATPINVVYLKLTMGQPGAAAPAAIRLSPDSVAFPGTTVVGATSPPLSVQAVSAGSAAPTLVAVGLSGADPLDFHLSAGACTGATLAPGGPGCSVSLTFSPLKAGTRKAMLTWIDAAPADPPVAVTVSGTGAGGPSATAPGTSATGSPGQAGGPSTAAGPARAGSAPASTAGGSGATGGPTPRPTHGPTHGKGNPVPWVLTGVVLAAGIAPAIVLGRRRSARHPRPARLP